MSGVDVKESTRRRNCLIAWMAIMVIAGLALLPLQHASAESNGVTWKRYDVDIVVRANGDIHVTERQLVRFEGRFSTGFANIPLASLGSIDNVDVAIGNSSSTTPAPAAYLSSRRYDKEAGTYTYQQSGSALEIDYAFDPTATNGTEDRLIVLDYDVIGALRVYDTIDPANQQLWWTAIASDVTDIAPIEASTVTVTLPKSVGETYVATPDRPKTDGRTFTWNKTNLVQGQDFEIRLQFPPITSATAQPWQARDDQIRKQREEDQTKSNLAGVFLLGAGLLMLIGGGIGIYALWYARGRDPQVGPVAEYLTEPPDDLGPGAAGTLIDEVTQPTDVISSVLDLARRDVIHMDDKNDTIEFEYMKQPGPDTDSSEHTLLAAIFGENAEVGQRVSMAQVQQTFISREKVIHDGYYKELVDHDFFKVSPETTRVRWKRAAKFIPVFAIAIVVLILVLTGGTSGWMWFPIVIGIILTVLASSLSSSMPRKTLAGAESAAKWRAFKKYLQDIEKYEKLDESKTIFDKYLPFAVAFGLESGWVAKFAQVDTPMPDWFGGDWSGSSNPWTGTGRGYGQRGGTWIFMGDPFGGFGSGGNSGRQGGLPGAGGGGNGGGGMPDLQDMSDSGGRSLQSGSDSFFDMLESAAKAFGSNDDGKGGGWGGGGGWSGGGGGGGFSGGGSGGGGGGGGGRGFG